MGWFLKPLPNKIRVVLTASEDNYPDSWRYVGGYTSCSCEAKFAKIFRYMSISSEDNKLGTCCLMAGLFIDSICFCVLLCHLRGQNVRYRYVQLIF